MSTHHNHESTRVTHVTVWVDAPIETDVTMFLQHRSICVDVGKANVHLRSAAAARSVAEAFAEAARQLAEFEAQTGTSTGEAKNQAASWAAALEEAA